MTKQSVIDWADTKGLVAEDLISHHFEERFGVERILIHSADVQGDFMMLKITTDQWFDHREFALTSTGSLIW